MDTTVEVAATDVVADVSPDEAVVEGRVGPGVTDGDVTEVVFAAEDIPSFFLLHRRFFPLCKFSWSFLLIRSTMTVAASLANLEVEALSNLLIFRISLE